MMKKPLLLCFFLTLVSVLHARDTELWMTVNLEEYSSGAFSTKTHTHYRIHDEGYLRYYRISQKFTYKLNDTWKVGLHPVFEKSRKSTTADWKNTYRLDFEANPTFSLGSAKWKMRNRLELRWKEGQGSEMFNRFRHRSTLSWKADWLPGMTSIGIADEIFFDFDAGRFATNWFYPVVVSFDINDHVSASIAYMLASSYKAASDDWEHTNVIEASASIKF